MSEPNMLSDRMEIEQRVVERAWRDDAFHQQLLNDPQGTAKEVGLHLPAGLRIVVHEETPDTIHFVLPLNPAAFEDGELSDAELELVAGGSLGEYGACAPQETAPPRS